MGFRALAGADRFLQRHRKLIVVATSIIVLLGPPFLFRLHFNFDPTNSLQDTNSEAVATLRRLNSDPRVVVNGAEVLTSPADAEAVAKQFSGLPEVAGIKNLDSFIPDDQQQKLKLIANAAVALDPVLKANRAPAASDRRKDVAALKSAAKDLQVVAAKPWALVQTPHVSPCQTFSMRPPMAPRPCVRRQRRCSYGRFR